MMKASLLVVALLACSISSVYAACGMGSVDLTGLKAVYTGKDSEYTYKMSVCDVLTDSVCSATSICQINAGGEKVAGLGKFDGSSQPTWSYLDSATPGKGVKAAFTNGDSCWMGTPQTRIVNVEFPCGSDSTTFTINESPKCTFTISLPTSKSCPGGGGSSSGGLSGGWVFIIILLVVIPVYIVVGCIYKRKKLGAAGSEACPNWDFWSALPGLVKDGFRFTIGGCKKSSSYNQL